MKDVISRFNEYLDLRVHSFEYSAASAEIRAGFQPRMKSISR